MLKTFHTIRTKLFLTFTLTIVALQLVLWLASAYGMQSLIILGRERNMAHIVSQYHEGIKNSTVESVFSDLAVIAEGNLTYIDTESGNFYTTLPQMRGDHMMQPSGRFNMDALEAAQNMNVDEVKSVINQQRNNLPASLTVVGKLSSHEYLMSERQLSLIRESSKLFSGYVGIAGILAIVLGAIISGLMAKRVTRPIIVIEEQAKKIATFDFSSPNAIQTKDEIGTLANSVNQIAVALEDRIEQLHRSNLQLKGEIEQERQLDRARRAFVTNVSHELKTPISMIMGYADGLKHGIARTPEQQNRYYDVIIRESEHMSELISQLLDLSAYQTGKMPCEKVPISPNALLSQCIERFQARMDSGGIQYQAEIGQECELLADPKRMEMVFSNLLGNAIKYADAGSTIEMVSRESEGNWELCLTNRASDFNPEDLDQLTVSFFRGHNARENQAEGFGIGLSTVKEIVVQHGGAIQFAYEDGLFKATLSIPK